MEQRNAAKQAKAALALLMAPACEGKKSSDKVSEKSMKKSSEKTLHETKEGMALVNAPAQELHAEYQADYDKSRFAAETTKNKLEAAATKMFQF